MKADAADAAPTPPIIEPIENLMEKHRGKPAVFFLFSLFLDRFGSIVIIFIQQR